MCCVSARARVRVRVREGACFARTMIAARESNRRAPAHAHARARVSLLYLDCGHSE